MDKKLKIVIIGSFKWSQYAPALYSGFLGLGHEVFKIDYDDYVSKDNGLVAKIQSRFHIGFGICKYNRDIKKKIKEVSPDFIFLYRCYSVYNSTLKIAKKSNSKIFSYNNDDPFSGIPSKEYYRYFIANARLCDATFVYRKKNIDDFKTIGVNNTHLLLPYYIKTENFYTNDEKDIPIAFLGHYENDGRDLYIKKLIDNNIPVTVFGDEAWRTSPLFNDIKHCYLPAVRGAEYNKMLNRVNIALIFFSKINKDTYTRRCFEIPRTKSVMLSEYSEDMNRLFPEGEYAFYFKNTEELVDKSRYLLSNPMLVELVAERAYNRIHEMKCSEIDRAHQIIEIYKTIENE